MDDAHRGVVFAVLWFAVTKSNEWSGKRTFGGRCLHSTDDPYMLNPYEDVIETIGKTLRDFGTSCRGCIMRV